MGRRHRSIAIVGALLVSVGVAAGGLTSSAASATSDQSPTLSVSGRLDERRYVATGSRAYVVGTEAGRFPAMGFHTRGEMGGLWTPPLKMLDGIWFGIGDRWIGPATRFSSGYGYVEMELPTTKGVRIGRTDFVPDRRRAVLIGLHLRASESRTVSLKIDAHSELMSAYPWGETAPSQQTFNLADEVSYRRGSLVFSERGRSHRNAAPHSWAALVGSKLSPAGHATGGGFRGPQSPPVICPATGDAPARCDDTEYGRGKGGRLRYRVALRAGEERTIWFAVAGSDEGRAAARSEYQRALHDPAARLRAKVAARRRLAGRSVVTLPGDPRLAESIEWSKQNLADSVQVAHGLEVREVDAGTSYPPPEGRVDRIRFFGAGFPDYPWLFGTDGEYTAFPAVAAGQFHVIKDHLRALRDVSLIDNGGSGKVVHEAVTEGSVYFGSNDDPGNTDETAKFPSAVALVWRWTGDNAFRDEMYAFTKSNMRYIFRELDADGDGWPEGLGNVERPGMGEEKLDNTVYTIRGLYDLAAMAKSKNDMVTFRWARDKAKSLHSRFEQTWWMSRVPQHADSIDLVDDSNDNTRIQQRHWIGATPMEAELYKNNHYFPGLTTRAHGNRALDLRETRCYTGRYGLFHTGEPGCDPAQSTVPAERTIFTLNTAIMAVAEGNYGRLGRGQQRFYTRANRRLQLPNPDEQPGAMPEIAPSPDYGRSIDNPFNERAMVLQAWGTYGTLWPVIHQQLGVRPDLGRGRLDVVAQVPAGQSRIAGRNIRLGSGHANVRASRGPGRYRTVVHANLETRLRIGHVLPAGARITGVRLNGHRVPYDVRLTNRGREISAQARSGSRQRLVIRTG